MTPLETRQGGILHEIIMKGKTANALRKGNEENKSSERKELQKISSELFKRIQHRNGTIKKKTQHELIFNEC